MLGVFASVLLALGQPGPLVAPEARSPQPMPDFRLSGRSQSAWAYIDIANIYRTDDGRLLTRVFTISPLDEPTVTVGDGRFDCAGRQASFDSLIAYDRTFRSINPAGAGPVARPFDPGSAGDQTVSFVCGSVEARRQAQYLGADWRTAARMLDPRFR